MDQFSPWFNLSPEQQQQMMMQGQGPIDPNYVAALQRAPGAQAEPIAMPSPARPTKTSFEVRQSVSNPYADGVNYETEFNKAMESRKPMIEAIRQKLAETESAKPEGFQTVNLKPLLAFADQLSGGNSAANYQAPQAQEKWQAQVQKLRDLALNQEDKLSDDQLNFLKMKAQEQMVTKRMEAQDRRALTAMDKSALNNEFKLRNEWDSDPITKNTKAVSEGLAKIEFGYNSNDPADYLTMVYGLMRMQDPESSVKEAEFQTGRNIGGWPEKWQAAYQNAIGDRRGGITQIQKDSIMKQARGIYQAQLNRQKEVDNAYKQLAEGYRFNPDNVVLSRIFNKDEGKKTAKYKAGDTVTDSQGVKYQFSGKGDETDQANWIMVR